MKKLFWILIPVGLSMWVIVATFGLKTISYDKIPREGQTFDEYAFAWMGKSFLQSGRPMSWTTNLEAYQKCCKAAGTRFNGFGLETDGQRPTWNNLWTLPVPVVMISEIDYGLGDRQVGIVQPYFDHPPLAGIVYALGIGSVAKMPTDVTAEDFRYMNRYLGVLTAGLLFVLASLIYSPWVGLLAASIYSTTPSTLLSARLTLAENVLIPTMLLSLICLHMAIKKQVHKWWIAAGVVAGFGILVKMSGVAILITGMILGWESGKNIKKWWGFVAAALGIYGAYLIYGSVLGGRLFWQIIFAQSGRAGWGIINFYQGLERLFFNGFPIDGWWVGGLATLLYLSGKQIKNFKLVSLMTMVYILTIVLLGGDNNAWYLFPLGVMWVLGYAGLISDLASIPNIYNSGLFFLFGLSTSAYWGFFKLRPDLNVSWTARIMAVIFFGGMFLTSRLGKKYPVVQYIWLVFLVILLHRMYVWNFRGMQFILSNWGDLPYPLMWHS